MNPNNPLAQLRDIHLPEAISWWPLAVGWWIVGIITIICIYLTVRFGLKHFYNQRYRRQALVALDNLPDSDQHRRLIELFSLLRQVASSAYPQQNFSSLNNVDFIRAIQSSCSKPIFTDLPSNWEQIFYARQPSVTSDWVDQLIVQSRHWIKHHPQLKNTGA